MEKINLIKEIANIIDATTLRSGDIDYFIYKNIKSQFKEENFIKLEKGTLNNFNKGNEELCFIDASNNTINASERFIIEKLRLASVFYPSKKRKLFYGYVIKYGDKIKIIGNIKNLLEEEKLKELSVNSNSNFIQLNIRELLEKKYASELPGVVIMDGTLENFETHKNFLGISKGNSIYTNLSQPASISLLKYKGPWFYKDAFILGDLHIGFFRLLPNARIYRIDYFDEDIAKRVISQLISLSSVEIPGYPSPLIEAHRLCYIPRKEVEKEWLLIKSFSKTAEHIEDLHHRIDL